MSIKIEFRKRNIDNKWIALALDTDGKIVGTRELNSKIIKLLSTDYQKIADDYENLWRQFWRQIEASNCHTFTKFVMKNNRNKLEKRYLIPKGKINKVEIS
ncbi:MAG: hypothetical protein ACTSWY_02960 [Promethearchaeota archaeon]